MKALRWVVGTIGELLITFGLLLFLFVAWQLWWTDVTSRSAKRLRSCASHGSAPAMPDPCCRAPSTRCWARASDHYVGTALPGQIGNFATAGHRTTYGKPYADIDKLRPGDFIVIETKANYIMYAVQRHVIVTPNHVDVIAPVPQHPGATPTEAWMTMIACHPKFSAQQRYVVFSKLVRIFTRAGGLPASFMAVPAGAVG